eukprot:scaffold2648_cov60-Cyclotella_meneghiniana.AAC.4
MSFLRRLNFKLKFNYLISTPWSRYDWQGHTPQARSHTSRGSQSISVSLSFGLQIPKAIPTAGDWPFIRWKKDIRGYWIFTPMMDKVGIVVS